jgi:TolB protein
LALGVTDYLELMSGAGHAGPTTETWHRAMNCGFRLSATAGEDSILSLHQTAIIGANRTYAYLGPKLDWNAYVEAIRAGRTFITNGPLVDLRINNQMPGDEIRLPAGGGNITIQARLQTLVPVERFEILHNNQVVASANPTSGLIEKSIPITRSGWFTARALGGPTQKPTDDSYPIAETGAIYVMVGDQPIRSRPDAEYFLRWIDDITRQANEHPGWRSERERKHVLSQFAEARKIFEQRAQ